MNADKFTLTQAAHMRHVLELAKINPAAAFREADMIALAESSNEVEAEWIRIALEIQPRIR